MKREPILLLLVLPLLLHLLLCYGAMLEYSESDFFPTMLQSHFNLLLLFLHLVSVVLLRLVLLRPFHLFLRLLLSLVIALFYYTESLYYNGENYL
jgi:hypothetical protein